MCWPTTPCAIDLGRLGDFGQRIIRGRSSPNAFSKHTSEPDRALDGSD
jgi:hypothetical protein